MATLVIMSKEILKGRIVYIESIAVQTQYRYVQQTPVLLQGRIVVALQVLLCTQYSLSQCCTCIMNLHLPPGHTRMSLWMYYAKREYR